MGSWETFFALAGLMFLGLINYALVQIYRTVSYSNVLLERLQKQLQKPVLDEWSLPVK